MLFQTEKDYELLICCNGCTDGSVELAGSLFPSVYELEEANKAKALNFLLEKAKGEFIAVQDDDDIWKEHKLYKQLYEIKVAAGRGKIIDVCGTYFDYINERGVKIMEPLEMPLASHTIKMAMMEGKNVIGNTTALVRTEMVKQVGGWDPEINGIEDYDLWLKLLKAGALFNNIPEVLVHHRLHQASRFNTKKFDIEKLLEKYK